MISDTIIISETDKACDGLEPALALVERTAAYGGYSDVDIKHLRHLAKELIEGCAAILDAFSGSFWMETDAQFFKLQLQMNGLFPLDVRDRFIELTRDRKNTLPHGFFAKLGVFLGDMLTGEYALLGIPGDVGSGEMMWEASQLAEMIARRAQHDPADVAAINEAKAELDSLADNITVSARADEILVTVSKALPGASI